MATPDRGISISMPLQDVSNSYLSFETDRLTKHLFIIASSFMYQRTATETPPLSAGSGYSSHSPGPTSPLPQSDFSLQPNSAKTQPRTPSPGRQFLVTPTPTIPIPESTASGRPPFSDSARGTTIPQPSLPRNPSSASSMSAYSRASKPVPKVESLSSPIESESEYGGLAYADSTDYEDDDNARREEINVRGSLVQALNDAASKKGSRHIQFGSVSLRSRSRSSDRKSSAEPLPPTGTSRADSVSSYSSTSSAGGDSAIRARARADSSSTVARALGLSQTPPSEYAKLGGPGVKSVGGRMMTRSASGTSSASSRSATKERSMETLLEDPKSTTTTGMQRSMFGSVSSTRSALRRVDTVGSPTSPRDGGGGGGSKSHRSNTVPGLQPQSPDGANKPVKLPARSLTSPLGAEPSAKGKGVLMMKKDKAAKKVRTCLRCAKAIEDGKWVSVDGGGVLCERCWKNMYLPKVCVFFFFQLLDVCRNYSSRSAVGVPSQSSARLCRRPMASSRESITRNASIAIHAKYVFSSSKNNLTPKLPTTHTRQKPFPDKTFYVYDGKPLCAYHYHEANDSLCAAARCGQPIEGPCAVSHTGDRYHPEHMTCEFPGYPACRERLEKEYWEVEGRMLCERHANRGEGSVGGDSADEDGDGGEERWVRGAKAMKRITRFIDLAGAGGGAAPVEGSELR